VSKRLEQKYKIPALAYTSEFSYRYQPLIDAGQHRQVFYSINGEQSITVGTRNH